MSENFIEFRGVSKEFPLPGRLFERRRLRAVRSVDFSIKKGEILAVVGESGCGKTTIARMLAKLYAPNSGSILVDGKEISGKLTDAELKEYRGKVQMIFQDPFGSLNPAHKLGYIVGRPLQMYSPSSSPQEIRAKTIELFRTVGLTPAETFMEKHPGQISGGQRQRIVIARALAVNPSVLLADEPTSMLDVSIGIEIMNLMLELKREKKLTYLYITHNLASARYMAERIMVMYAGTCVEEADTDTILASPLHPYSLLLLSSTPEPYRREKFAVRAKEDLPDPSSADPRCLFHARCPYVMDRCRSEEPPMLDDGARRVKCFLYSRREDLGRSKIDIAAFTTGNGGENA
jgi:peptide/nickel transport system ATP-binding protein